MNNENRIAETDSIIGRSDLSNDLYHQMFQRSPDGIVATDQTGTVVFANDAAATMLGYTAQELLRLKIDNIEVNDNEKFERRSTDLLTEGRMRFETLLRKKDGSYVDAEIVQGLFEHKGSSLVYSYWRDISGRRRVEKSLRESQARFQAIFEQSHDGISVADFSGRYVMVNIAFCIMTGYREDELLMMNVSDLIPGNVLPELFTQVTRQKQAGRQEVDLRRKDGSIFTTLISGAVLQIGENQYVHGIVQDISAQKRTQDDLRVSEDKYRELVDSANSIILTFDAAGTITYLNDYCERFFGYAKEELLGRNVVGTIVPETESSGRDLVNLLAAICADPDRFKDNENENITRDGSRVWVRWTNRAIKGREGVLNGVLSIGHDITARKKAETSLRESEERFRTLAQASFEGIVISQQGVIRDCNDQLGRMLGYRREELINIPICDLVPEDFRDEVMEKIRMNDENIIQHDLLCKDGSRRRIEAHGKSMTYQGEESRITAIQDITDRKRTERELERYRQNLEDLVNRRTADLNETIGNMMQESRAREAAESDLKSTRLFLANTLDSILDPIMVLDRNQCILMVNQAFKTVFMGGREAHLGALTCYKVLYNRTEPCQPCFSKTAQEAGAMATSMVPYGDAPESMKLYDVHVFPFFTTEGRAIGSVHHLRDVTARRKAEERIVKYQQRLRSFAHQLMMTEGRERRKIAQELHDGFPQKLVLSKLFLQELQSKLTVREGDALKFARIYELYDEMTHEVRSLTYQLAPPVLYEVGLEPALERLLKNLLSGREIRWVFENMRNNPPLQGEIATVLYSMIRELIMNVIKYAEARRLNVAITEVEGRIYAVVQDDGIGMAAGVERQKEKRSEMSGFGIFSIRERLRYLNGRLHIEPGLENGTQVRIEIPLEQDRRQRDLDTGFSA